ncbi:hypothetical protein FRB97_005461, partial [Tulasnella sp. 331]
LPGLDDARVQQHIVDWCDKLGNHYLIEPIDPSPSMHVNYSNNCLDAEAHTQAYIFDLTHI